MEKQKNLPIRQCILKMPRPDGKDVLFLSNFQIQLLQHSGSKYSELV